MPQVQDALVSIKEDNEPQVGGDNRDSPRTKPSGLTLMSQFKATTTNSGVPQGGRNGPNVTPPIQIESHNVTEYIDNPTTSTIPDIVTPDQGTMHTIQEEDEEQEESGSRTARESKLVSRTTSESKSVSRTTSESKYIAPIRTEELGSSGSVSNGKYDSPWDERRHENEKHTTPSRKSDSPLPPPKITTSSKIDQSFSSGLSTISMSRTQVGASIMSIMGMTYSYAKEQTSIITSLAGSLLSLGFIYSALPGLLAYITGQVHELNSDPSRNVEEMCRILAILGFSDPAARNVQRTLHAGNMDILVQIGDETFSNVVNSHETDISQRHRIIRGFQALKKYYIAHGNNTTKPLQT